MFTKQELQLILGLINITPITGKDAMSVAQLQQKISIEINKLNQPPKPKTEEKTEKK